MEGNNLDLILGLIENQALLSWNRLEVKGSLLIQGVATEGI